MLTKEEYKKTYIKMMDSIRCCYKGELNCDGVGCQICPLSSVCRYPHSNVLISNAFDCVELVEKWGKEHPNVTNGTRFLKNYPNAEVYRCDSNDDGFVYVRLDSSKPLDPYGDNCAKMPITWWESEVDK